MKKIYIQLLVGIRDIRGVPPSFHFHAFLFEKNWQKIIT